MQKIHIMQLVFAILATILFSDASAQKYAKQIRIKTYLTDVIRSDTSKLVNADVEYKRGDSILETAVPLHAEADILYAIIEKSMNEKLRDKARNKEADKRQEACDIQIKSYSHLQKANSIFYDIFFSTNMLRRVERLSRGKDVDEQKAMKLEKTAKNLWRKASRHRDNAASANGVVMTEILQEAYTMENNAIDSIIKMYSIYCGFDPDEEDAEKENRIAELKKIKIKLDNLISNNPGSETIIYEINSITNELNSLLGANSSTNVGVGNTTKDKEELEMRIVLQTIKGQRKENQDLFEQFGDEFGEYSVDLTLPYKKEEIKEIETAIVAKDSIRAHYNAAKIQIENAYSYRQEVLSLINNPSGANILLRKIENKAKIWIALSVADSLEILAKELQIETRRTFRKYATADPKKVVKTTTTRKRNQIRTKKTSNKKSKTPNKVVIPAKNVLFRVQIGAFREKPDISKFGNLTITKIEKMPNGALTAYLTGDYSNFKEANSACEKLKALGFKDSYVVAYQKERRVNLDDAVRTLYSKKSPSTVVANHNYSISVATNAGLAAKSINAKDIRNIPGLVYTVQLGQFNTNAKYSDVANYTPIYKNPTNNGLLLFSVGLFKNISEAQKVCTRVKTDGISDAFCRAYYNGVQISLDDAKKYAKENKISANIIFKIRVATYKNAVPVASLAVFEQIAGSNKIEQYGPDAQDFVVVQMGLYNNYDEAEKIRTAVVKEGATDSYIIAYKNGKQIAVAEARRILNQ